MSKLPLNYCLVTQNLASIIEDSITDSDRFPDVSDISGEVTFTPNIANGKAYQLFDSDGEAYTVPVSRIPAKIINGEIVHEDSPGVYLFAAGAGSNPDKITYSVEYRNLRTGDLSFSLSPLKFEAIPGGEVDLTLATPVVGASPAGIVRGPRGTSLESIVVDGSELVFTAVDDVRSFEMSRIPLDEMVRAEADAAADGVLDRLSADVTASQSARDAAEGHATRAATSETNAKTSETNAGDYAAVATTAATEAVDAMDAAEGAKDLTDSNLIATESFKNQADIHATSAATSETNAKISETNATTSENNAATSETNAAQSETKAKTSETNAAQSETNAKTSETNAKTSETNASQSETEAGGYAAEATTAATEADTHASRAATSETNAKTSETNAAQSETNASQSETKAKTSETNAKTSETNAKTSETNAKTSETNAKQSENTAGDYAAVATTAATEAVDAMERATDLVGGDFATREYVNQTVASGALMGTGSPEGKVAAPIGSVYTDSAAINGAIRWIKTSGTGSTGWVVEYGDTGIRDISSLLKDATGSVTISRIGQIVYLEARVIKPEETLGSGSSFLASLPVGFRPPSRRDFSVNSTISSSTLRSGFQFTSGAIGVWNPSTSDIYYFQHSWITTNSWPTSLPGTPA